MEVAASLHPSPPQRPSEFSDIEDTFLPSERHAPRFCARQLAQGHLDVFGEQLLRALTAEIDHCHSIWEASAQQLREQNEQLRAKLAERHRPHEPKTGAGHAMGSHSQTAWSAKCSRSASLGSSHSEEVSPTRLSRRAMSVSTEKFKELDIQGTGVVKVRALADKIMEKADDRGDVQWSAEVASLLEAYRAAKPPLFHGLQDDEISYHAFKELMSDHGSGYLGPEHLHTLNALRSACLHEQTRGVVSLAIDIDQEELGKTMWARADRLWWLEPAMGCVILFNAAIIGLRQDIDPDADLWTFGEMMCTFLFLFEFVLKLGAKGFLEHFCGADWKWNWFDLLLVVLAMIDTAFIFYIALHGSVSTNSLRDLTVFRMLRLLRIARLARLFKVRYMKELTSMAIGNTGLRTLFWATVLLFGLVYAMGVFTHQIMADWRERTPCGGGTSSCNEYEVVLYDNFRPLFGDLFKTCFTVFRCITGDCSIPAGLPLTLFLLETQGKTLITGYICFFLFVVLGVFNLIMAVFIENTLDSAKQDRHKQDFLRRQEQVQVAQSLQQLVDQIVVHARRPTGHQQGGWTKYLPGTFLTEGSAGSSSLEVELPTPFTVTKTVFAEAMGDQETAAILEDLDISRYNQAKLFEILDSDGNGELDLQEIVDGVMRLRGPADKSDIVSASLMIRSLQRSFADLQTSMERLMTAPRGPMPVPKEHAPKDALPKDHASEDHASLVIM